MPELVVEELSVAYDNQKVVKNCSFTVKAGEIVVILGASGDGKTSLLKALAGLLPRHSGRILFDNEPVADPTEQLVPGHEFIKLVNQDFALDLYHTVEENIRLRLLRFDEAYRTERVRKLLRLTKLTSHKTSRATELSGGQRQRLAIARALADEPELVLLDEPFNQLDFQTKATIGQHIKQYLRANGIGAVMVTHNGLEALEWADRILFLKKGRILRDDSPEAFYNHPSDLNQARFFGEVNKIKLNEVSYCFRPEAFKLESVEGFNIKLPVQFKSKMNLGWYFKYFFQCEGQTVILYSTENLEEVETIFVRTLVLND